MQELLSENLELKKEVEETEKLINIPLEIETIEKFDEIVGKITELGFKTAQEAKEKAEKLGEVKTEEELKYCLNAKKFCYYEIALNDFLNLNFLKLNDEYVNLFDKPDFDLYNHESEFCKFSSLTFSQLESMININNDYKLILDNPYSCSGFWKVIVDLYSPKVRNFVIQQLRPLIVLRNNAGLTYIRKMMVWFCYLLVSETILLFLSNPDRYEFFLQFHHMLAENLLSEDKQLFHDYLDSCKNKLQSERNRYHYFYRREWTLTGIIVFGIIASAAVLAIYFLEIYAATWFFWLGIVGVVLTVAAGLYLELCIRENYNEIKAINRAIEVFNLDKIKEFEKPEPKKILTIETDRNEIINNDEINSTEQNDAPESEQGNSGENIKNINNL